MRISEEISRKLDEMGFGVATIHVYVEKNFTALKSDDVISTMTVTVNVFDDAIEDCKDILKAVIRVIPSQFKMVEQDGGLYTTEKNPVLNEFEYDMYKSASEYSQELEDAALAIRILDHWDIIENNEDDKIHEFLDISDLYYLDRLWVSECCRSIGLGSYIMEFLPEIISATLNEECVLLLTYPAPYELGADKMNSKEWKDGEIRLQKFYERAGFSKAYNTKHMYLAKEVFTR